MKTLFNFVILFVITLPATAQLKIESHTDLRDWLPATLLGYNADENVYSAELKQDGEPYFMTAKKYQNGGKVLSIVAFDYRKTSERITKATASWSADRKYEDAKQRIADTMVAGCKANESYDKINNAAQMYIYKGDRYLITLSATAESTDFLAEVVQKLSPANLPK
jgi:hypothetical protein